MFKRVALFLVVNIAVLMLLSITFSLLGIRGLLDEQGVNLNLQALLVYALLVEQASNTCLLYTSPSPRDATLSRMPSSA